MAWAADPKPWGLVVAETDPNQVLEMVDRVARAIYAVGEDDSGCDHGPFEDIPDGARQFCFRMARAAIEAMREPTAHMTHSVRPALDEDWYYGDKLGWDQIGVCWREMIDAALGKEPG